MKDTVITVKRKKTEIVTLIVCFIIANLINLYAIVRYKTSYTELFFMLGYVLILTVALYILWTVIRLVFYAIKRPKRI
ncbi:MAG: hypothetical protein LBC48_03685 [Dysgonamonadaceae bacterium]|jgi:hypothetical protein|nr:hypothetical protein [Dysgonamonadaceae bacterium]